MGRPCDHSHSHRAGPAGLPELTERLRRNTRRVTGARQAILRILDLQAHPLSNQEIFRALGRGECDLATVYRSLHLLEDLGMVQRFDLGDGVARFELAREGGQGHHHHLVCTHCAEVVELEDCLVGGVDEQIAQRNGFKGVTHKLEFFGLCPACQQP
jgi:Fur family ferric uptake transcriptional regulator